MAWTAKQKQLAVRACESAGISDEQRTGVILRNFANAAYKGDITSTSPTLTNHDFEQFMAVVERQAGGTLLHFTAGYWQTNAADRWQRMRHRCGRLDAALQAAGVFQADSLGRWIAKRTTGGATDRLEQLDYHGLLALSLQLTSFCRQRGVATPADASAAPRTAGKPSAAVRCVLTPLAALLAFTTAAAAGGQVTADACRTSWTESTMAKRSFSQPPPAEVLPMRLTRDASGYAVRVGPTPGGAAATFDRDERLITLRDDATAAGLIGNLKTALTLMESWDTAEAAERERIAVIGQVEELGRFVEAALPARHDVARRFYAACDELNGDREPTDDQLRDTLDDFDSLPAEERRRILNGWTPTERPAYAEVAAQHDVTMARVLEVGTGGRRASATCGYRLDDTAGVNPVRVLLTAGVTKRQVLDGLEEVAELVANDWDDLIGSDTPDGHELPAAAEWFHGHANKKGVASQSPDVPALAGNRNEEGREVKPAAEQHTR